MPKLRKKSAYTLKNEARKRKGIKLELCEPLNCRKEEIEGLESSTVDSTSKLENEKILETIYGKNLKLPFNYIIPRKITSDNLQNSLNDCHASTSKDISNSDTIKSSENRKLWLLKKRQDPIYKSLQQKKDAERKQLKRKYPQFLQKESEYRKKRRQNPEVLQRDKKHKQKIRKQAEVSQKERQHKRDIRQNPEVSQKEKEHKQKIRKRPEVSQKERQHKRDVRLNPEVSQREKEHKKEIRKRPEVSQKERQHKKDVRLIPEVSQREKEHKKEIRKRPEVSQKERQHKRDVRLNPEVSQREKEHKQEIRKRPEVSQKERQHKRDVRLNPEVSQREKEHKQEIRKRPEVSQKELQHKRDIRQNPEVSQREKEHKQEIRKRKEVSQKERQHKKNPAVLHKEKQHKRKLRLIPGILQKENQQKKIRLKANNIEELITKFHKIVTEGPLYICTCCKQLLYKKAVTETSKAKIKKGDNSAALARVIEKCVTGIKSVSGREWICKTCHGHLKKSKMPPSAAANGMEFPPQGIMRNLNPLEFTFLSPLLPFMKIHKAPVGKQLKIQGNMVVVPSDTVNTVQSLPRLSNNTSTIKAQLKRRLRHKHSVYSSNIRPEMVREGAKFLSQTGTLYKSLNIKYNLNWTDSSDSSAEEYQHSDDYNENNNNSDEEKPEDTTGNTENLNIDSEDEWEEEKHDENVAGSTDTLLSAPDFFESNERDLVYSFAPAENNQPISIFIEKTAEEQAYPGIFCGQARIPNDQRTVPVSYGEIVKSELRNMDRRCARNVENIFFKTKKLQMKYLLDQTNIALRKFKTDGQNLTAKDVKQKNVHNLIHLDQGYKVLKTLRGSPPYFQAISKELFAMIQTLGPATFFLTLSAAETQWVHLLRILAKVVDGKEYSDEELQNLTWAEKSHLIQSDPVTCARHFDHSLQSFMTNFILSDLHPVGNVTDWFSRIEFQQRGSPHVHMMIWCKNAPNLNDNSNEEICMYIDKFITCSIQNADDSLTTLVKLQQHKHSRTCKKKGKKICRFGFPKPPMQQTVILHPLEDTVTLKDNHKSNWNKIHDTLVAMNEGENISFKQFLEKVALNETEYILAVRSSIATPTVFLKRSLLEIRINNYSTACLKAWRANMDLQFVIDVYACAVYIASYITKTQRGMSELLTAACKEANSGNKSIREQVRLISNKFLNAIEISAQEASYLSLQLPLKKSSRQVIFINTSPPDQRVVLLKPQNQLESMNDDDDEIECKGLLSRYPERPKSMETLSLAEFASSYERVTSTFISRSKSLCKNTKDGCLPEKQHDEDQEEDEDISYNKTTPSTSTYRERRKPKIIRSVHYNPDKDIENYHRELLMLYSPWRNEELDILAKCSTYTERFQELKPTIEIKRQLFEPYRRAIKYAEELLSNQPELDEGWNGIAPNTQHRDQQDAAQREKITNNNLTDYDIGPDLGVRVSATEDLNSYNELSNGKFCAHMRSLNQQQIQFVYNVVHQIKTSDKPVYHFLSGGAGVGKSFVTKALYQMILKFYNRRSGDDFTTPKVLLMAPTGKAAYHINGNTIHSTLRIPCNQSLQFRSLESSSLNTLQTKLGNVQLIFIDEISMVGFKMLNFIHQRLMEIKQSKEPFGGVSIIAVGDLFQLKPVMDSYIFQPPKSGYMPLAINLWEDLFCMTELTIIMRQRENKEFAELLNRLREGNHTSNDIELLKTQCIEENTTNYPHDTPHVFFSNKKVNGHNATIFQKTTSVKTTAKAKDRLIGNYKEDVITKVLESFQNKSTDVSQLSTILEIAENLTYEITLNLDCEDGLINGAACIVKKIKLTEIPFASGIIWVKFPTESTGNFLRQNKKHLYSKDIQSSWTPIEPASRQFAAGYKGECQIQRMQFPLRPAAAKTIHRSQGDTLDELVVDLTSYRKIDHIHYVALSRVTKIEGLKILHLQENKISINSAVKKEMERLRKIPPATSLIFINEIANKYTIVFLNANSLHKHIEDVRLDYSLTSADLICFCETRFLHKDNDDATKLQNFHTYRQDSNASQGHIRPSYGLAIYYKKCSFVEGYPKDVNSKTIESSLIQLQHPIKDLLVCFLYRPPKIHIKCLLSHLKNLEIKYFSKKEVILMGDFNVDWSEQNAEKQQLQKYLNSISFTQLITTPTTDDNTCIDLIFTNLHCNSIQSGTLEVFFSPHKPVWIAI